MRTRRVVACAAATATATAALLLPVTAVAAQEQVAVAVAGHQVDYRGEAAGFGSGLSRSSCDVNGDGVEDMVVGDRSWERGEHGEVGAAYVIFGSESVPGGDLSEPASAGAVRVDGPPVTVPAGAWLGWSVSCLGDVNGDQIDDFVVGTGSRAHHDVAVVFGAVDFGPADLGDLGSRGYLITDPMANDRTAGDRSTDNFGYWVAAAGDVDGDGLADVAIGDVLADSGERTNNGRVWVVQGKSGAAPIDVRVDVSRVLLTVDGARSQDRLATVEAAGDVNGDGRGDLLLGGYSAAPWPGTTSQGAGYLVFGGTGAVDLAEPLGGRGFTVAGPARGKDRLGISGAGLGDIDGDGLDDVILGADGATEAGLAGGAAVVLGSTGTAPVLIDPAATPAVYSCADGAADLACTGSQKVRRGYWINGAAADSHAGFAVAGIPDANGDAVADAVIGAYGEGSTGAAYVVYSDPARTETLELGTLSAAQGERHVGATGTATYGRTVASAGDVDGNGAPDFFFGGVSNNLTLVLRGALRTQVSLGVAESAVVGRPVQVTATVRTLIGSVAQDAVEGTLAVSRDGAPVDGLQGVPVRGGTATFEVPEVAAGTTDLDVRFVPADAARFAAASDDLTLEVAKADAQVGEVRLTSGSVVYGGRAVTARVAVPGGDGGEVSFFDNGRLLGTAAVHHGAAEIRLARPAAGTHRITAEFAGTDRLAPGAAAGAVLRVERAKARRVTVRATAFARGTRPKVRVVVGTLTNGARPTGTVTVKAGRQQVTVRLRAADRGRVVVRLRPATTRVRVSATFTPRDTANIATTRSATLTVRVRR